MCTACDEARPAPAFFRFFAIGCGYCAARNIQYIQRTLRVPPERKRERCRKVLADALVEVQDASMDEAWIRASAKDVAWALAPEKMGGK